jgi:exonuclease III
MGEELRVCSFNCRGVKSSTSELQKLCDTNDIVLAQETWLLDNELTYLGDIHTDFYAKGISSVDTRNNVLVGRPHGGLAILWRKTLCESCKVIEMNDERLMAIEAVCNNKTFLFINVYMPYCTAQHMDDFQYYLCKLESIVSSSNTPYIYIIGDYNANLCLDSDGRALNIFGKELLQYCALNGLIVTDFVLNTDLDAYTYYSEAHGSVSWLDHVVSTVSAHALVNKVEILYDFVTSDHHPLVLYINAAVDKKDLADNDDVVERATVLIKWDDMTTDELARYKNNSEININAVKLDHDMILCDDPKCLNPSHVSAINRLYNDIACALKEASHEFTKKIRGEHMYVAGWNEYCRAAHSEARDAYVIWRNNGRPRQGFLFHNMKRSRAYFKLVFRKCKQDSVRQNADKLADKLLCKDDKGFWKEMQKMSRLKARSAVTVNNATGTKAITDMWQTHFKELLNSSKDTSKKSYVLKELDKDNNLYVNRFTSCEINECIRKLKNGKVAGLDNLYGEHFKYANEKLCVLLSLVFNAMIIHGHLPAELMDTIIIPLLKDKQGDLSDVNNYRPLAITCIASKILEMVILKRSCDIFTTTHNQFGFKSKHATDMCIFMQKQVCEYYVTLGSPVYLCYLDASKAFDKVNHWHLFSKLMNRKLPYIIIRLLMKWYTTQSFIIQWEGILSTNFNVSNGVRQGGVLSPILFNIYMDDLSNALNKAKIGCMINSTSVNHLFYADDAIIMAPSPTALQKLLNICVEYADVNELVYNAKKTVSMCVKPKWLKNLRVPDFNVGDRLLNRTEVQKYLGVFIMDTLNDDKDMNREMKSIY